MRIQFYNNPFICFLRLCFLSPFCSSYPLQIKSVDDFLSFFQTLKILPVKFLFPVFSYDQILFVIFDVINVKWSSNTTVYSETDDQVFNQMRTNWWQLLFIPTSHKRKHLITTTGKDTFTFLLLREGRHT